MDTIMVVNQILERVHIYHSQEKRGCLSVPE